ncbi:FG-GAP repeat domain-containing protein [Granulicella sibirica]|uniref:Putative aggregation factor core protein MAFp3, isoform C n=1 Tax=Granulicella sibirica TaxID=2479048 RepID=A0A4Q0T6P4_9BACT|nr:VCBS repeat-containing protein [Granulicella sibirica]RXH58330.1 putative aggregation factor core protein MAFp3, isoform C [Granulicella sibirica]
MNTAAFIPIKTLLTRFTAPALLAMVAVAPLARAQQFLPATTYPIGRSPQKIAVGDFNQDGIKDLAIGDTAPDGVTGTISILFGKKDGSFRTGGSFLSGGGEPDGIVVRDFNHDGHLDLAVANYGGGTDNPSLAILLGVGDGTFGAPDIYKTEKLSQYSRGLASGLAAGDFNHDGNLDLAVTENSTGVTIYLGKGNGKFKKETTYAAEVAPKSIIARDFNRDGKLDLAVTNENSDTVSILLGNGDGTFALPVSYPAGAGPAGMRSRDLNGDGILDIVVANAAGPDGGASGTTVTVLLGVGDGTFQAPVSYPAGDEPFDVAVADFNGDGILDLAVADVAATSDETGTTVSLLLGNGDGTFGAPTPYTAGAGPVSIVARKLNRDSCPDLAVANFFGNSASVLLNSSTDCKKKPATKSQVNDPEDDDESSLN